MKISYNVLKKYLPELPSPLDVKNSLIMHSAEVDEIILECENLKDVVVWEVLTCEKHEDSDKLNVTSVDIWEEENLQIICWAPNVRAGLKVAVAKVWAKLTPDFVISKAKIRGVTSCWMLCSLDELWLISERQEWILELPLDAKVGQNIRDYFGKNDHILDIDNKAINHRPDMFSHIWVIRELATILDLENSLEYLDTRDFSSLPSLNIKNEISNLVARYMWLSVSWVENKESPDYIKAVISTHWVDSKGLLVDITNYSLYFYGQPTHCFDADKIEWNITIRMSKKDEEFIGLDDKTYKLTWEDIVIADDKKVIALWWVMGSKNSCVDENTKNIIIESAHFDQAVIRKTGRLLWIRTDALNVFEKNIPLDLQEKGLALIVSILEEEFWEIKLNSFDDVYKNKQETRKVPLDIEFINNLIWKKYDENYVLKILKKLWYSIENNEITVPFYRLDINYKADIAEEIARIHGYDNVESTTSNISLWAVSQDDMYLMKRDVSSFFVYKGFYEIYNYSFTWKKVMEKAMDDVEKCVPLKNFLSEDASHMRNSLIPGLLESLESNIRDQKNLKLFELEKSFVLDGNDIVENYFLSGVMTWDKDVLYYDLQSILVDFFRTMGVSKFEFKKSKWDKPYYNSGRVAEIVVRWKVVWYVWEIHPIVAKRFDISQNIAFFDINADLLKEAIYSITKAKEISIFQEISFDLSFVFDKSFEWKNLYNILLNCDKDVSKVELVDIYENEEKMPGKRSYTYKIALNSLESTIWDDKKAEIIKNTTAKVEKLWGEIRWI